MVEALGLITLLLGLARQLIGAQRSSVADEVLRTAQAALGGADVALDDLRSLTSAVQAMVKEGREPTETEWAMLRAKSGHLHEQIQAVKIE